MEYFGQYRSSTTGQTGCVKEFATPAQATIVFPPQVVYTCDLCKIEHGFRYFKGHQVSTPKQRENFVKYCESKGIEADVEVH